MSNVPTERPTAPPPPQPVRTRALTVFVAVTALVMGLGAVLSVVPLPSTGPLSNVIGKPADDRVSLADAPVERWSAEADSIIPGGMFVRPDAAAMQYLRPGVIEVDDLLITSVVRDAAERDATLVAFDDDGNRKWTTPIGSEPSCSTTSLDGALPCLVGDRLHMIRLSDGVIEQSTSLNPGSRVVAVGGGVLIADYFRASAGTAGQPTAHWERDYEIAGDFDDYCIGSGDAQYFGITGSMAHFGTDLGQIVLDVANGTILANGVVGVTEYPGRGIVGNMCDGEVVVLDLEGKPLYAQSTAPVGRPATVSVGDRTDDGRFLVGDSAYSFTDGRAVWTAPGASFDIVAGDVALDLDHDTNTATAYRRTDGTYLWSSPLVGRALVTDGERLILEDAGLTAINLETGAVAWTDDNPENSSFDVVSGGLFAATRATLRFLAPDEATLSAGGPQGSTPRGPIASYESSDAVLTRCGRAPTMVPVEYRAEQGGLAVRMEVTASCPTGDIVSTNALRVTLVDADSPAAAAVFDLSASPLYLPPTSSGADSVTVDFLFGPGTFYRMPNALGTTDEAGGTVARPTSRQVIECYDEGTSSGPGSVPAAQVPATASAPVRSDRAAIPAGVDPEQMALDALRAQARADMPFVRERLADRWVAQLSSKRAGLQAPDITGPDVSWTYRTILDQHLRLRLQYPEVRLVWSDDWTTFTITGWWITVAGNIFGDADAANRWCDDRSIPTDECFAKIVSDTRGPEGTTKYRR